MSAPAWQRALHERRSLGVELELDAVFAAFDALGRPAGDVPAIHVVGTNGKGSTAAMCAHALAGAGLRVGLYTSPHLHRVGERVRVDGAPLSDAALEGHVEAVLSIESCISARPLTFFEVITLAAMRAFAARAVDVLVLEAGLGGRLDATRVGDARVTVITSIGHDHARYLGDTITAIAGEKAAVIRADAPCVSAPQRPEARAVIERVAVARGASLRVVSPLSRPPRGLPGAHQRINGALALAAIEALADVTAGPVAAACASIGARGPAALDGVRWPGRLERVAWGNGSVVFDVAHNLDGVAALAEAFPSAGERERAIVFGCMEDKDAGGMLAILARLGAPIWLTRASADGAREPRTIESPCAVTAVHERADAPALARACDELLARGGELWVCGSVYLVAELRARYVQEARADELPLHDPMRRR